MSYQGVLSRVTRIRTGFGIAMVFFVVATGANAAEGIEKKGKPPVDLSVRTEFLALDSVGASCTFTSDGGGIYQDNVAGVSSILTANVCNGLTWGDWRFNLQNASRSINEGFFTADLAVAGAAPAPWEGYKLEHAWMNVQCTCRANENMYTMVQGEVITCPLLNNFVDVDSGRGWGYAVGEGFTGFTETTDAQITCNSAPGDHCVDWYIEPIGAAPGIAGTAIARGLETVPSHPKDLKVNHGSYNVRFRIHVSLP